MHTSPQATNIKEFPTAGDFLNDLTRARKLDVDQLGVIDGSVAAQGIANAGAGPFTIPTGGGRIVGKRFLQNCGITALKYKIIRSNISQDKVSTNDFHGVLAACAAQDDGLGSQIDLSNIRGSISVMVDSGTIRCCVMQAYVQETEGLMVASPENIP